MNTLRQIITGSLLVVLAGLASCSKTDEPTHPVGSTVPYTGGAATQTIVQLLDSLPDCTFYDSAFRHAGMAHFLDSLRDSVASVPFTLFVPTDDAFRAAGYTLQQIGQTSPAELDSILYYLATSGGYAYAGLDSMSGGTTFYTLLKDPALQRTYPNPGFSTSNPYTYWLSAKLRNGTLWLNGVACKTAAQSLQAKDGVVWPVDKLVEKPVQETYQVLKADTSYSYYMAALKAGDSLYTMFFTNNTFDDLPGFYVRQGRAYTTVLAPTNDAFRKAGFADIKAVSDYINNSICAINGGYDVTGTAIRTNMDSILDFHRVGYPHTGGGYDAQGYVTTIIYSVEMLYDPGVSNMVLVPGYGQSDYNFEVTTGVSFQNSNGQVVVHRVDYPNGRAVNLVAPIDITTLNGVVHRVDNLLLPTP